MVFTSELECSMAIGLVTRRTSEACAVISAFTTAPVIGISTELCVSELNTSAEADAGTVRVYRPSAVVSVPIRVPFAMTRTPASGCPVATSRTP